MVETWGQWYRPWDDLAESEMSPKVGLELSVGRIVDAELGGVGLGFKQEAKDFLVGQAVEGSGETSETSAARRKEEG